MRDPFKDLLSANDLAALVQHLRRKSFMLPIEMKPVSVLQMDHSITAKRRTNTLIRGSGEKSWTIVIQNFDCSRETAKARQRKSGRKAVLERGSTGSKLGYYAYGDFETFAKAMTLCKTYGYFEEKA